MNTRQNGFTLIELMIAVVIVAILSSIAYGSYQNSVTKSKRTDAKTSLAQVASELERCFTMNGQYTATSTKTCSEVTTAGALASSTSNKGYYTLAVSTLTTTTYTITATPSGWTDSYCNVYSLTQTGAQSASGSWGTARCWND